MSFFGRILGLSSSNSDEVIRVNFEGEPEKKCDDQNKEENHEDHSEEENQVDLQQEEKGEPDDESEEEEEEVNDDEQNFLNHMIFKNDYVEFYKTDAQSFVNNIKIWSGQRDLNKDHINYLAQQLTKERYIMGTFTLVRDENETVVLVNGHHRVRALKKILRLQPSFNCDIIIELYKTDRLESKRTLTLFKNSNTILNVKVEDMPNKYALSLLDKLTTRFDGIFRDKDIEENCNRPYLHKRLLFSKLKQAFQKYDLDEDSLFNAIIDINDKLRRKEYNQNKLKSKGKCVETGCYLGLIEKCLWLDKLLEIYN